MNRYFIHQHFAQETARRLALLRHAPQRIALIGADGDISRQLLAQRYPQAVFTEYDHRADWLEHAAAQRKTGFFAKISGKTVAQHCQDLTAPLPEAGADMLWANLSLLHGSEIVPVLENWARALKTGGLLFLHHFGADTLPEIRALLAQHGITCAAPTLVDMHDLGDMLFHHGFLDPVTDTAKLVLTYSQAQTFWQDMNQVNLWQALQPDQPESARELIDLAWQSGELTQISLETVFAHAVKKISLPENEQLIQFYPHT